MSNSIALKLDAVKAEFAALLGARESDVRVRYRGFEEQIHVRAGSVNFMIDVERFEWRDEDYRAVLANFNKTHFRFRRPYNKVAA